MKSQIKSMRKIFFPSIFKWGKIFNGKGLWNPSALYFNILVVKAVAIFNVFLKKLIMQNTPMQKKNPCLQYELSHNSESIPNEIPVIFLF